MPAAVASAPPDPLITTPAAAKPDNVRPAKVGDDPTAIDCGSDKVTAPVAELAIT